MEYEFLFLKDDDGGEVCVVLQIEDRGDRLRNEVYLNSAHAAAILNLIDEPTVNAEYPRIFMRYKCLGDKEDRYMIFAIFDDTGDPLDSIIWGPRGIFPVIYMGLNMVLTVIDHDERAAAEGDVLPRLVPGARNGR